MAYQKRENNAIIPALATHHNTYYYIRTLLVFPIIEFVDRAPPTVFSLLFFLGHALIGCVLVVLAGGGGRWSPVVVQHECAVFEPIR